MAGNLIEEALEALETGDAQGAKGCLLEFLETHPRSAEAFNLLGMACSDLDQWDLALVAAGQAVRLNATAENYYQMGLILEVLGNYDWAERFYRTASQVNPDHPSARTRRLEVRRQTTELTTLEADSAVFEALLALATPTVSVCMIVKDERLYLPRCLAALAPWIQELVVVDTGSTDGTQEVVAKFAAENPDIRVVQADFTWCDDFSAARNASLAHATGEWVLVVDADEVLVVDDAEQWLANLRDRTKVAAMMTREELNDQDETTSYVPVLRLVRNLPGLRYTGVIHESVDDFVLETGERVAPAESFVRFRHYGTRSDAITQKSKITRNLLLTGRGVEKEPKSWRAWFDHGRTLLWAGRFEDAQRALARAEVLVQNLDRVSDYFFNQWMRVLLDLFHALELPEARLRVLERAIQRSPEEPHFRLLRGQIFIQKEDLEGALGDLVALQGIKGQMGKVLPHIGNVQTAWYGEQQLFDDVASLVTRNEQKNRTVSIWYLWATLRLLRGDYGQALFPALEACRLKTTASSLVLVGQVCLKLSWQRWAEKCFNYALTLEPEYAIAKEGLREVVALVGCSLEPSDDLEVALQDIPKWLHPTVSASLIVKNESRFIRDCLESLVDWVHEIVVMDTGSTDDTMAIVAQVARENPQIALKAGFFEWCDDFAAARNAALALTTCDWVLSIDADETLCVTNRDEWLDDLRTRSVGLWMMRISGEPILDEDTVSSALGRLFQRHPDLKFRGRIHEDVGHAAIEYQWLVARGNSAHFYHKGYAPSLVKERTKGKRNLDLALATLRNRTDDAKALYEVARAYLVCGEHEPALTYFQRVYDDKTLLKALAEPHFVSLILFLHRLYWEQARFYEAAEVVTEGLKRMASPDLYVARALVRSRRNDWVGLQMDMRASQDLNAATGTGDVLGWGATKVAKDVMLAVKNRRLPNPAYDVERWDDGLLAMPQRTAIKVSACLIIKDEAAVIERCLESIADYVDEIIIVDTGSTDDSYASIRRFFAAHPQLAITWARFDWCDDFSSARNASLELARGDWILVIDADECLQVDNPVAWQAALNERNGYAIANWSRLRDNRLEQTPLVRLFPNDWRYRYHGFIHEDISPALREHDVAILPLEALSFQHDGYTAEAIQTKDKWRRNLKIAAKQVEATPDDPKAWYDLARSSLMFGDREATIAAVERAQALVDKGFPIGSAQLTALQRLRDTLEQSSLARP